MVRIRLRRMGSKGQPSYRIVVADKEAPRDGAFIEIVGTYNPRTQPESVKVAEDRALYWLKVGAQPSDSVEQIFKKAGTMDRYARLMKGEAPETLIQEAEAHYAGAVAVDPRTNLGRVVKPGTGRKPKKDKK
jgi:small subunit ribosomal protein S16